MVVRVALGFIILPTFYFLMVLWLSSSYINFKVCLFLLRTGFVQIAGWSHIRLESINWMGSEGEGQRAFWNSSVRFISYFIRFHISFHLVCCLPALINLYYSGSVVPSSPWCYWVSHLPFGFIDCVQWLMGILSIWCHSPYVVLVFFGCGPLLKIRPWFTPNGITGEPAIRNSTFTLGLFHFFIFIVTLGFYIGFQVCHLVYWLTRVINRYSSNSLWDCLQWNSKARLLSYFMKFNS